MAQLDEVLATLERLAPARLAASWDNVGLLVEGLRPVARIGLAVDLTEAVFAELVAADVDLVVAYHPPIFGGLKSLTGRTPTGRVALAAARAGVHVYSPHTALDAVPGGLADWLLEPFGPLAEVAPIEPSATDPGAGAGRRATLATATRLLDLVPRIKAHLGLETARLAAAPSLDLVRTVAVCPGAGGSLFERLGPTDLLLTGELRHHDVLARTAAGGAVLLTDHTNTERGYLPRLADTLRRELGVEVVVSAVDADPLRAC